MKYTLAFDVYGTLIDTSGVFNSLEKVIGNNARAFMELWRNKQLEYSFRRGLMDRYVDFSVCTREALEYCCLSFEINLTSEQLKVLMDAYKILPAFEDVNNCLQRLSEGNHRIFAFSNGSANAVSGLIENAGISQYFEGGS